MICQIIRWAGETFSTRWLSFSVQPASPLTVSSFANPLLKRYSRVINGPGCLWATRFYLLPVDLTNFASILEEEKTRVCAPANSNSIARCLNVNIYWAVTFLQQIHQIPLSLWFEVSPIWLKIFNFFLIGQSKFFHWEILLTTKPCGNFIDQCSLCQLCFKACIVNQKTGFEVSARSSTLTLFA